MTRRATASALLRERARLQRQLASLDERLAASLDGEEQTESETETVVTDVDRARAKRALRRLGQAV